MRRPVRYGAVVLAALLGAAGRSRADAGLEGYSYANTDQFVTTHLELVLDVDFVARMLRGGVALELTRLDPRATQLVLDTDGLTILGVAELTGDIIGATEKPKPIWVNRPFHLGKRDPVRGSPLIIDLPPSAQQALIVRVDYETSPQARGLAWRVPATSASHDGQFLYTLSAPLNARSWIPLQDTPQVRASYRAHVHTPEGALALMSAGNEPGTKHNGDYWLSMLQPVPPAALTLLVGDLHFHATGPHSGVYAETAAAASAAARQLAGTEALRESAQRLLGSSPWPRFDVVVMPRDFPLPKSDSPNLSLFAPTLLTNDAHLAGWVADSLAYAWVGEFVSNAAWRDRWIGLGLAAYLSDRLVAPAAAVPIAVAPATPALASELEARGYDDVFTLARAERGRQLFRDLEQQFGRAAIDRLLYDYVARFGSRVITTAAMLDLIEHDLLATAPGGMSPAQLEDRVYDPGTLPASSQPVVPAADILQTTGRLDLLEPAYRMLLQSPAGAAEARRIFALARRGYHPFVAYRLETLVAP